MPNSPANSRPRGLESRSTEARLGSTLRGKWTLERLLGSGGMAAVYVGRHRIGRLDAIKILHPHVAARADLRERFEREARAANAFHHPGAVEIRDVDTTDDGVPFLVMELAVGETLAERELRGPISQEELLRFADQILDVLAAAHAQGLVHRDVKPENLLVADGIVKVLDFGIAKMPDGRTSAGTAIGTAAYMAPEQVKGEAVDARADLFALGATLFRLLAGRFVHDAPTTAEILFRMGSVPAPPLASVLPGAPAGICQVVDRSLGFQPSARYPDARTMQADVRALLEGRAPPFASSREPAVTVKHGVSPAAASPRPETQTFAPPASPPPPPPPPPPPLAAAAAAALPTIVSQPKRQAIEAVPRTVRVPRSVWERVRRPVLAVSTATIAFVLVLVLQAQITLLDRGRSTALGWAFVALVGVALAASLHGVLVSRPSAEAQRAVLRVARARGGKLTALDLVADTTLGIDEATRTLAALERAGRCASTEERDARVYRFPELEPR